MITCRPWIFGLLAPLFLSGVRPGGPPHAASRAVVEPPASCQQCGMDRARFARSRMLIRFPGGEAEGTCSLRCAAELLGGHKGRETATVQVADYQNPARLLEARTSIWVIGGQVAGVMTAVPKWAFLDDTEAMAFIRKHGGRKADFAEALRLAQQEIPALD